MLEQRSTLIAQLQQLRGGALGRAEASAAHYSEREADSHAQMQSERDLEFTLDARESAELRAVDAALQRMDAGVYGVCVDCGNDIHAARLLAAPETPRCIHCQERAEQSAPT